MQYPWRLKVARDGHQVDKPQAGSIAHHWASIITRRFPLYWLGLIALLTIGNLFFSITLLMGKQRDSDLDGIRFNFSVLTIALVLSLFVGFLAPAWWRRAMVGSAVLPIPILLFTSGSLASGASTLMFLAIAGGVGRAIAAKLPGVRDGIEVWAISATIGFGLIGGCSFFLGMLGVLRPLIVWLVLAMTSLGLLAFARNRWRDDVAIGVKWLTRPVTPNLVRFLLVGASLACFWLNLLGALSPEILSDAVRQRLPAAVQFARTGNLYPHDPEIVVARDVALGEMIYGAILTISPLQGAKLTHFVVGIVASGAIYALGRRLGGSAAGAIGSFAFYSTIITAYLSQSAYLDLFLAMFAVTATLVLAISKTPNWRAILVAGSCLGCGVAVKVHFGYVAIGLAVILGLISLQRGSMRLTIQNVAILTASASLVAAPWLARSFLLTGSMPGAVIASASLSRENPAAIFDLATFGFGRSLRDLFALPFTAFFTSIKFGGGSLYGGVLGGHIGYLPIALVPLLAVGRRHYRAFAILVGTLVAVLFWFYSAQYLRYGLPMLAILCALGGGAYRQIQRSVGGSSNASLVGILVGGIAFSGLVARMLFPDIAHAYAFGLQGREAFLEQYLTRTDAGSFSLLQRLDRDPTVTRVFALPDGARLYTHARISSPFTTESGLTFQGDERSILRQLAAGGYSHILVDRQGWVGPTFGWDRLAVLDETFLRRHTELVAGGNQRYLYRIIFPEKQPFSRGWDSGTELLHNGDFEQVDVDRPLGWSLSSSALYADDERNDHAGSRAIRLATGDRLSSNASVASNTQYLLTSATWSANAYGFAQIKVEWHDNQGNYIDSTTELLPISPEAYHTLSILVNAPAAAHTASIIITSDIGTFWIDDLSLRVAVTD